MLPGSTVTTARGLPGSSTVTNEPYQFDVMESALDGLPAPNSPTHSLAYALQRADSDPEQIQLALRGLPVFPHPPKESDASATPEAAFIVAGGPTCLLREVLLPPYQHPDAPTQLYATIDFARRAQNMSEFKVALRSMKEVLLVWKKKHLWKVLRQEPSMSLADGLLDEVRRAEERRQRAIYKAEERERREEEEREFARKMAEQNADGEGGDAAPVDPRAAAQAQQQASTHHDDDSEDEDDDDYDEDEDGEERAARRRKHKQDTAQANQETPGEQTTTGKHEQQEDEVLEFPEVTPEEELEFLTFFYNSLGGIYQSAGAAAAATGGRFPGIPGVDGVRWGRLKVIPCTAESADIRIMLQGTKHGAVSATSISQPAYAANLETSLMEEEDVEETEEDFIASSPQDLSNSSDSRALIALWQAKRAHDLYVALKEAEKNRLAQEQRERDLAARGGVKNELDEEDDMSSSAGDQQQQAALNTNTTLGIPGFASINIPNLSLSQLQSESKALGLFGFPHITNLASVGGAAHNASITSSQTQSGQEREQNFIFWSTQPIVLPQVAAKPTESQKSLGLTSPTNQTALLTAAAPSSAGAQPAQKLINPYTLCSSADAVTYSNLGTTLFHLGNYPLSLRCFYVSLQIRAATLRPQDDEYIDLATSLNNLGVVLAQLQYYSIAWNYFNAAAELARTRLDPVHPRLNLITNNLSKIKSRRQGVLPAPGLLQELRTMAENKEKKEHEAREKRAAKNAKKGGKGGAGTTSQASTRPSTRKTARPLKKGEELPKEFHEDPRFFQPRADGQPPIVPPKVEGAVPGPLGSAAAAIKIMPLRNWDVQMGEFQKLLLEFGPAKKKTKSAGGKKKSKKK